MSLKSGSAPAGTPGVGQGVEQQAAKAHGPAAHGTRFRRLRNAAIGIVVLALVIVGAVSWIDRVGWKFFHTGEGVTKRLAQFAAHVAARDAAALEAFYAADFLGKPLGLTGLELKEEKDGVRVYRTRRSRCGSR